jgi:hypothetical protein
MYLSKFIHTETGRTIMSILLGLGLASLFREVCKGKNCVIYEAPEMKNIEGKIYKHNDKCYKFKPESSNC